MHSLLVCQSLFAFLYNVKIALIVSVNIFIVSVIEIIWNIVLFTKDEPKF